MEHGKRLRDYCTDSLQDVPAFQAFVEKRPPRWKGL